MTGIVLGSLMVAAAVAAAPQSKSAAPPPFRAAVAGKAQSTVCWLALTFALEKGGWRLVFDQNTLITDPVVK